MVAYLDTSVLLQVLLEQGKPILGWGEWDLGVTSVISRLECYRAIYRLRLNNDMTDSQVARKIDQTEKLLKNFWQVPVYRAVLDRSAQIFSVNLKTIDAIHLSSALLWQEHNQKRLEFLTHDRKLGLSALTIGVSSRGFQK